MFTDYRTNNFRLKATKVHDWYRVQVALQKKTCDEKGRQSKKKIKSDQKQAQTHNFSHLGRF